jgi:tRNA threonylcarbamoyladenosine biosynthesis protein TsaB
MSEPLVLALDTSFGPVGVGVATLGGRVLASSLVEDAAGRQTEVLPTLVDEVFRGAGLRIADVRRVVVTVGPGAFTGIRIGLAFAKGIKVATGAVVLGVSSLECLAFQALAATPDGSVAAVIDAKRGEVYAYAIDRAGVCWLDACALGIDEANRSLRTGPSPLLRVTGSGQTLIEAGVGVPLVPNIDRVDVDALAMRGAGLDPARHLPVPAYLREPDAKLPA